MPHLDFFVDFALSGQIAGVGLDSQPDEWLPILGDDYLEASFSANHLIRGYGLVEVNFADFTGEWLCYMVHVKPLKLLKPDGAVPPPIAERYGPFPAAPIRFDEVADAIAAAGGEVWHLPARAKYANESFWVPQGKVAFDVVSPVLIDDFKKDAQVGDIAEVTNIADVEMPPGYGTRYR